MIAAGLGQYEGGIWDRSVTPDTPADERPTVTVRVWIKDGMMDQVALINAPDFLPMPSKIQAETTMALEGL